MRALIVGEGKHETGVVDFWCDSTKSYISLDGWMQPIIRLVLNSAIEISVRQRRDLTLLPKDKSKFKPMPGGHGDRALIAKRAAVLGSFDMVVFAIDADSPVIADWREIVRQIEDGFSRIEGNVAGIACVPMSASESWLLADAQAWSTVSTSTTISLPNKPEAIWGPRDDPEGGHPHRLFARVCGQAGVSDDHSTRLAIAESVNLATLRAACPISFEPFVAALQAV